MYQILKLDNEHIVEVFELLCSIPFEQATMNDIEPPTKRHAGIEQLIQQLGDAIDKELGDAIDKEDA